VSAASRPGWARYAANGYEVSSRGDRRFSALYARLRDGRTIEQAYQLDVKGYRSLGATDWRVGKGRPPVVSMTRDALWTAYLALWQQWASENPAAIADLRQKASDRVLTDRFASTPISQARALDVIRHETD
jgi:hypothetical protein